MMDIGGMRVTVLESRMGVHVRVSGFGVYQRVRVDVVVVTIRMEMAMLVFHGGMDVVMFMQFPHQQPGTHKHERNGKNK